MNKILAKTIGKWKIWAIVAAVIITAGVIVSAIFGFNPSPLVGDTKTVTVRVESYLSDTQKEKIGEICVAEFNKVDFMHLTRKGHKDLAAKLASLVPELVK